MLKTLRSVGGLSFPLKKNHLKSFTKTMSTLGHDHLERTSANSRNKEVCKAKVEEITDISSTVKLLKMYIDNKQFSFKAGQWVDMMIPNLETVGGFSMCSPPHELTESSRLHLAIKYSTHPPALWVHTKCKKGSTVDLRVGGDFYYDPAPGSEPRHLVLIAGGVGINPLFSMLQHFAHSQSQANGGQGSSATMLYSAKSEEELVFKDDLLKIESQSNNIRIKLFSTGNKDVSPKEDGVTKRRIQEKDIHSALSNLQAHHMDVYLCGPLPFIEDMKAHCVAFGIPSENVHYERWW